MQIPIGQKRKRGRPKQTSGALEEQDLEYACSESETDDETQNSPAAAPPPKKFAVKKRRAKSPDEYESDHDLFTNTAAFPKVAKAVAQPKSIAKPRVSKAAAEKQTKQKAVSKPKSVKPIAE